MSNPKQTNHFPVADEITRAAKSGTTGLLATAGVMVTDSTSWARSGRLPAARLATPGSPALMAREPATKPTTARFAASAMASLGTRWSMVETALFYSPFLYKDFLPVDTIPICERIDWFFNIVLENLCRECVVVFAVVRSPHWMDSSANVVCAGK